MHTWHSTTINISGLPENMLTEIQVAAKKICITRRADKVYAFTALCPHQGAPLCDGWIDPMGRIVCPLHKFRFNPANGYNTTGEGYKLYTYPVEIRNDEIFIGLLG